MWVTFLRFSPHLREGKWGRDKEHCRNKAWKRQSCRGKWLAHVSPEERIRIAYSCISNHMNTYWLYAGRLFGSSNMWWHCRKVLSENQSTETCWKITVVTNLVDRMKFPPFLAHSFGDVVAKDTKCWSLISWLSDKGKVTSFDPNCRIYVRNLQRFS